MIPCRRNAATAKTPLPAHRLRQKPKPPTHSANRHRTIRQRRGQATYPQRTQGHLTRVCQTKPPPPVVRPAKHGLSTFAARRYAKPAARLQTPPQSTAQWPASFQDCLLLQPETGAKLYCGPIRRLSRTIGRSRVFELPDPMLNAVPEEVFQTLFHITQHSPPILPSGSTTARPPASHSRHGRSAPGHTTTVTPAIQLCGSSPRLLWQLIRARPQWIRNARFSGIENPQPDWTDFAGRSNSASFHQQVSSPMRCSHCKSCGPH